MHANEANDMQVRSKCCLPNHSSPAAERPTDPGEAHLILHNNGQVGKLRKGVPRNFLDSSEDQLMSILQV